MSMKSNKREEILMDGRKGDDRRFEKKTRSIIIIMINFTRFWSDLSFSEQHKGSIITVHTHIHQHTSNQDKLSSFFVRQASVASPPGEKRPD